MYSIVLSAALGGMHATLIQVEIDVSFGLPTFQMVGSVSGEIKESIERVRTAIKNLGIQLQPRKVIGNLSPANLRKIGVAYDLPIAIGVLAAYEMIDSQKLKDVILVGELSLTGELQGVNGVLPITLMAKEKGIKSIIVPLENAKEAAMVDGICVFGADSLASVVMHFKGEKSLPVSQRKVRKINTKKYDIDFSDIKGQVFLKRALTIAVAGGHNVLMIGPPGSGKSMIAKRIPTIFPELTLEESMEVARIYSVMGLLKEENSFIKERPFRSVHHTTTKTALVGGGSVVKPGEISLAHKGVLFLDEIAEFQRPVLEVLRQPLEERKIVISRNRGNYEFDADFMLVAAMNPCPCGNYPNTDTCTCTNFEMKRYLNKISQPLVDRIDICIEVKKVQYEDLYGQTSELESPRIREEVEKARRVQSLRYKKQSEKINANIGEKEIKKYCKMDKASERLMEKTYQRLEMTARSYYKTIKVARTIADLEGSPDIKERHLIEAIGYRMLRQLYTE